MDNTQGLGTAMHEAAQRDKSQDHEKRIRELELQVHTLTSAVQHVMSVIGPLLDLAHKAENHGRIVRP